MPRSSVRPQSGRKVKPTARAPSPRSRRATTPKTTRNGVALNGRIPTEPAARIAAAPRSSGRRNLCGTGTGFATYWGGRTRTSNFPVNSRAVCQLTYTPNKLDVQTSRRGDVQDRQTTTQRSILQARLLRKTLHRLLLLGAQLLGQRDVCLHVHVPPPAVLFDAV